MDALPLANFLILHTIRNSTRGGGPPGLTYLTYRWRVKQGEEKSVTQAKNVTMHLCVCLSTLILPLIICNLSNLSLYRVLSCYQA